MANKITWADKVALQERPDVADKNKITAADMNQIKTVVNETIDYVNAFETKSCVLASGVTGEVIAYRFCGNLVYIVGQVVLSSVGTGVWNPICTIPFPPKYTNRSTDFSIENNGNDVATHARILNDGTLSVYPTTVTLSGTESTDVPFFISHIYY